jgi:hypothetical protein
MSNTSLIPTTVLAVEAKLLAEAANSPTYLGIADNDAAGRYAFLLGMCMAKLAEANRDGLRLLERQAAKGGR